jgi:GNAT superfamily N-acetyltransferase
MASGQHHTHDRTFGETKVGGIPPGAQAAQEDDLVKLVVNAEALHIARQVEAAGKVFGRPEFRTYDIAGSLTAITALEFTGKINHTVSFGMRGSVTSADLKAIEALCLGIGLTPELYMCDQADRSAFDLLEQAGYSRGRVLPSYIRRLDDVEGYRGKADESSRVDVQLLEDKEAFVNASFEGCKSNGRSETLLRALAQCAANRPDTTLVAALVDGKIAGTAALAYLDCEEGKVANLYIDSTLVEFRGLGIQRKLIDARLWEAKQAGCKYVIAQAAAGTPSARNFERAGFALAYTSNIYTLGEGSI